MGVRGLAGRSLKALLLRSHGGRVRQVFETEPMLHFPTPALNTCWSSCLVQNAVSDRFRPEGKKRPAVVAKLSGRLHDGTCTCGTLRKKPCAAPNAIELIRPRDTDMGARGTNLIGMSMGCGDQGKCVLEFLIGIHGQNLPAPMVNVGAEEPSPIGNNGVGHLAQAR